MDIKHELRTDIGGTSRRTEKLMGRGADEIERLEARLSMAEGCAGLSSIGIDVHAASVKVAKDTMAKLITAEARIEWLRAALQRIADMCPATAELTLAHEMADNAMAALGTFTSPEPRPPANAPAPQRSGD